MEILNKSKEEVLQLAVGEAIMRLDLVKPSAHSSIVAMVQDDRGLHPRALCTAYRKEGEQLSKVELKSIGVRANGFMSRRAYEELTERGLSAPLDAHMTTVLRAFFSYARWRSLWNAALGVKDTDIAVEALSFHYDMLPPVCPACKALDGSKVMPLDAHILPAPDCECETANYSIRMKIDWLYGIE